jgi:hypothetical protein
MNILVLSNFQFYFYQNQTLQLRVYHRSKADKT